MLFAGHFSSALYCVKEKQGLVSGSTGLLSREMITVSAVCGCAAQDLTLKGSKGPRVKIPMNYFVRLTLHANANFN